MLENLAANWPYLILMGVTAGFTSALLGIGGGVVMVPMLVFFAVAPQREAQGLSLGYMIVTTLAGFLFYYRYQHDVKLDLRIVALLTTGGVVGAFLGALAAKHIPAFWLQKIFAILMVVVAVRMFRRAPAPTDPAPGPAKTPVVKTQNETEIPLPPMTP